MLENLTEEPPVAFIVESETSANSLWEICKEFNISCVICSIGGVNNIPRKLPDELQGLKRRVIIDYDGDEELYNERVDRLLHFGKDIKIELPKGEDINSLYCNGNYTFLKDILRQ